MCWIGQLDQEEEEEKEGKPGGSSDSVYVWESKRFLGPGCHQE